MILFRKHLRFLLHVRLRVHIFISIGEKYGKSSAGIIIIRGEVFSLQKS